ncbi:hypothetical protein P691DRAFT_775882 [Macrolepiota fuliginosa MF-IS2]|uniref:Uncharacterized protein n=1 Tax=Macrolepiota fuliginosa MF-IS2 TaxID=1400762 RepID=A0A9P5XBQ3_9AGAR|nr:hypothetical protein P691DRAFT_775882 [Macrolepiota fuliginosa MF-IS2]
MARTPETRVPTSECRETRRTTLNKLAKKFDITISLCLGSLTRWLFCFFSTVSFPISVHLNCGLLAILVPYILHM